jgi:hypothetical protein
MAKASLMMTIAVFANVTTTRRRETVLVSLYRDGVGAVIADYFRGDFRTTSFSHRERMHIGFRFLTGYS